MSEPRFTPMAVALGKFVEALQTQSQEHIKPLHWHIACRLVIEGGFHPEKITPTPPFRVETAGSGSNRRHHLIYDEAAAQPGEQIILGGLKTKNVDVVVSTKELGPCLAVSVKGSLNAFRNLTNRMEEAVGDCTNLHISYPTLVYGFLHIIKANREGEVTSPNDIAVFADDSVADTVTRYHDTMARLTNRIDVRNEASRYEAVALALVNTITPNRGELLTTYPLPDDSLSFNKFLPSLYRAYDLRFVYSAPALKSVTQRLVWAADSPVLSHPATLGLSPRVD
jgi:hypothetical protein